MDERPATKGPWRIAGASTIRAGEHEWIARVHWSNREANAQLIVTSPDLLEQHKVALVELDLLRQAIEAGDPKSELILRVADLARHAREVITKAEGRA